jgi:ABC-2 type transport system ATP-binding protein
MANVGPAVTVKDLHKSFKLPHEQHSGIKQLIINIFKGVKGYETQKVLSDISFEIKKGEFFGIVGRNGSGKSTLLKLLAGIYVLGSGKITINGSLTPFIELGVGFNPELTGRENVFLNGALLGFSQAEIINMYDSIVDFAELAKFMDQKLKNYSSGMQVRLAFSIAIKADTDILLFDEVLAVGDENFQKKCLNVFRELKTQGKTIILVSHSTGDIEKFCDRVLVLDKAKQLGVFKAHEAVSLYQEINFEAPTRANKRGGVGVREILQSVISALATRTIDCGRKNL